MESVKINKVNGSIGSTPYATEMKTESHTFVADEPERLGGMNKGPLAHDYLLGSLIACTCITIQMYAGRKKWEVEKITVDAQLQRTFESGKQTTKATLDITFRSNLNEEQLERLITIAAKCPVHKTLAPAMEIEINLKR